MKSDQVEVNIYANNESDIELANNLIHHQTS